MSNAFDIMGNPIHEGDEVVFGQAGSMRLITGKVIKISAKTVRIEHQEYANGSYSRIAESQRLFDDVVVVSSL